MRILFDTHILLWAAVDSPRLSSKARLLLGDADNEKFFSVASLWEIGIKSGLGRSDFSIDTAELRSGLLTNGFAELAISGRIRCWRPGFRRFTKTLLTECWSPK